MDPLLVAAATNSLRSAFFGALAVVAAGVIVTALGAARSGDVAIGPWGVVKVVVSSPARWGGRALALFMDTRRSGGERTIGLGLYLVFVGVLLSVVTAILWGVAG
jgi:hypothetical protein